MMAKLRNILQKLRDRLEKMLINLVLVANLFILAILGEKSDYVSDN